MSYLAFHWIGIDLTHVGSSVFSLDILYQQLPHGRARTSFDWNARILSYYFVIDGLDRFGIGFHPANLRTRNKDKQRRSLFINDAFLDKWSCSLFKPLVRISAWIKSYKSFKCGQKLSSMQQTDCFVLNLNVTCSSLVLSMESANVQANGWTIKPSQSSHWVD